MERWGNGGRLLGGGINLQHKKMKNDLTYILYCDTIWDLWGKYSRKLSRNLCMLFEVITNNNESAKFKKWLTNSFASSKITKLSENKINCLKRKKNLKNFLTNKSKYDKIVKSLKRQEHWKLNSETTLKILFSYIRK